MLQPGLVPLQAAARAARGSKKTGRKQVHRDEESAVRDDGRSGKGDLAGIERVEGSKGAADRVRGDTEGTEGAIVGAKVGEDGQGSGKGMRGGQEALRKGE